MESLKQYFLYNKDYDDMSNLYYDISKSLKLLHDNKKCVLKLSSDTIFLDDDKIVFSDVCEYTDEKKSENIKNLSKLILGTHITLLSSFSDFSLVDDKWIVNNFIEIQRTMSSRTFPSEYLERNLLSGIVEYYHIYTDLENSLKGVSSSKGLTKMLRRASYSLAGDSSLENLYEKKSAFLDAIVYPFIIIAIFIIVFLLILIKNI